jgi:hypothetical protein
MKNKPNDRFVWKPEDITVTKGGKPVEKKKEDKPKPKSKPTR